MAESPASQTGLSAIDENSTEAFDLRAGQRRGGGNTPTDLLGALVVGSVCRHA